MLNKWWKYACYYEFLIASRCPAGRKHGRLSFNNVCLRYRPGLINAIDDVTLSTKRDEKISIVVRSGSGKSSLFLALFRIVDISSESICIDVIDIRHLPLADLRFVACKIISWAMGRVIAGAGTVEDVRDMYASYEWFLSYRCHLAIIPQDPFLFSGSVRENIDLTGVCGDTQLSEMVERCHLKDAINRLGGRDAPVAERGR